MNTPILLICSGILMIYGFAQMIRGFRDEQAQRRKDHHLRR